MVHISLFSYKHISSIRCLDVLCVPSTEVLNISNTKFGRELSAADRGGVSSLLSNIYQQQKHLSNISEFPHGYVLPVVPAYINVSTIYAGVGSHKILGSGLLDGTYATYRNILQLAQEEGHFSVGLPVFYLSDCMSDPELRQRLAFTLFRAISDTIREGSLLSEICILSKGKKESLFLLGWFRGLSNAFGIPRWYIRTTGDFRNPVDLDVYLGSKELERR